MFTDPFIKCSNDEIQDLFKILDHAIPHHGFRTTGLMVLKKTLSFYQGAIYYDVSQVDLHPARVLQFVMADHRLLICDGSANSILSFNQQVPFGLDQTQVLDYLRFYLGHVVGPHGLSILIDTVEDLQLNEEPTPGLRRVLNDKIVPLAINASLAGGGYQVRGTVLIDKSLYSTLFDVEPNGQVTAQIGRVLADILPVIDRILES